MTKPYIKVSIAEVTENENEERLIDPEYHIYTAISFDGRQEFNVSHLKLIHGEDAPTLTEVGKVMSATVPDYVQRWQANARLINLHCRVDAESIVDYFNSLKEAP